MRPSIAITGCILALVRPATGAAGPWGPFAAALPAQAGGAEPAAEPLTPVAGTKVSLIRPQGFEVGRDFRGFGRADQGASIMVIEMPGPVEEASRAFTKERLASSGINLLSREDVTLGGTRGILLHVTQVANETTFVKWIVAFGDEKESVLVTATFPQELEADLSRPLRAAVLSVRRDAGRVVDPFANLRFSLQPPPALKFASRIGDTLLFTQDGTIPQKSPADPVVVAGFAVSDVPVADPKSFSERRIAQTASVTGVAIESSDAIAVDGLDGREIVAAATLQKTGLPMVVYQVMLFEGGTYFLLQGMVGAAARSRFLPGFKEMARSFRKAQDGGRAVDPFADLPFSLQPPPALKFARRIGDRLLFTQDGTIPLKSPADPLIVVGHTVAEVPVADPKSFSEGRIAQTTSVTGVAIESSDAIAVDGLDGREIVAAATHQQSGLPMVVYQVTLFEGQTYFILQGLVGAGARSRFLPGFREMARSIRKAGKTPR